MKTYVTIENGLVREVFLPMVYDVEAPDWVEGDPSRIGQEIPIELRYPSQIVESMIEITDVVPMPGQNWSYNSETGVFTPPSTGPSFAELAESKRIFLRDACSNEITRSSFQSSALGDLHNYDCRIVDQLNLKVRYDIALAEDIEEPLWASDGTRYQWKDHTATEIMQVMIDMNQHVKSCQVKLASKLAAVDAATTRPDLDAIVW